MLFAIHVPTGHENETAERIEQIYRDGSVTDGVGTKHRIRRPCPYQRLIAPRKVTLIMRKEQLVDRKLTPLYPGYIFAETTDSWPDLEIAGQYGDIPWNQMEMPEGMTEADRPLPQIVRLAGTLQYKDFYASLFLNRVKRWYIPLYSWEEQELLALLDENNILQPSRGLLADDSQDNNQLQCDTQQPHCREDSAGCGKFSNGGRLTKRGQIMKQQWPKVSGCRVIITDGPLIGREGDITRINRHKRTAVLRTTLCGTGTEIVVPLEVVSPCSYVSTENR